MTVKLVGPPFTGIFREEFIKPRQTMPGYTVLGLEDILTVILKKNERTLLILKLPQNHSHITSVIAIQMLGL